MLNRTLEFLRIADVQPSDEKVRKRTESAAALVTHLALRDNRSILCAFLQGVVVGFENPLFTQESPAVVLLISTIKGNDATLPHDLKENAVELRAVAAISIGEVITRHPEKPPTDEAVLCALSILSALSGRPASSNRHLRVILDLLFSASEKALGLAAESRRQTGSLAIQKLETLKKPAEGVDIWDSIVPTVKAALKEVSNRESVDREEIETLWWMFTAFSELEQKPLADLSPIVAGFSAGLELAKRALVPPSPAASAMVSRAVETGRKQSTLAPVSLQDALKEVTEGMIKGLLPAEADAAVSRFPALLPICSACRRMRDGASGAKLGKDFTALTGIPLNHSRTAASWGAQVFREKILQRLLTGIKDI